MHRPSFLTNRDVKFCFDSIAQGIEPKWLARYVYDIPVIKLTDALNYIKKKERLAKSAEVAACPSQ